MAIYFDAVDHAGRTRYVGFTRRWCPAMMTEGGYLVMVSMEGDYDQWYVENEAGIEKLREYYEIEYGVDPPMCSLVVHGTHYEGRSDLSGNDLKEKLNGKNY
jgi:hypothetical protein